MMVPSNGLQQVRHRFRGRNGISGLGEGAIAAGGSHYILPANMPLVLAHGSPEGDEINIRITVRVDSGLSSRNINFYWTGGGIGTFLMDNDPGSVLYGVTTDRYLPKIDTTEHEDDLATLAWTGSADNEAALGGGNLPITNIFDGSPVTDLDHEFTFALNWDLFDVGQTFALRLRAGAALFTGGYVNTPTIEIVAPPERSYSILTENPLASVLSADPAASILSADPSMDILTRDPVAQILAEDPAIGVVTPH